MAEIILTAGFYSTLEVTTAGNQALGAWIRMAGWSAHWAEDGAPHPFPKSAWRLFGLNKPTVRKLLEANLIADNGNSWTILGEGRLWRFAIPARSKIPLDVRAEVYERDENTCQICRTTENLSLDHILPWSKGGRHTVDNLRVLCRPCNSSRGNRVEDML